jgi:hypothetical protein
MGRPLSGQGAENQAVEKRYNEILLPSSDEKAKNLAISVLQELGIDTMLGPKGS